MPPMRTVPVPVKPIKTERTHEENQERAYIAASRRSDRSLEARIESARRASEIHKRRTGRSLRVREEDVVNEEMYEEEDDDLPQQYRRLTAHLATSNTEFDRRLRAYLTNQVAMRTAFGQAAASSFHTDQVQSPSQLLNPGLMQLGQNGFFGQNQVLSPQMFSHPSPNYRTSPYPTPNLPHGGSLSAAATSNLPNPQGQQSYSAQPSPADGSHVDGRRTSLPAQSIPQPAHSFTQARPPHQSSPTVTPSDPSRNSGANHLLQQNGYFSSPSVDMSGTSNSLNPISLALPMESQQLLAGGPFFDCTDSYLNLEPEAMPFKPGPQLQDSVYSVNGDSDGKDVGGKPQVHMKAEGLDQMLWGGSLDPSANGVYASGDDVTPSGHPFVSQSAFDPDFIKDPTSVLPSGELNPPLLKDEWDDFLQGDVFEEQPMA